jgi:nucleolin
MSQEQEQKNTKLKEEDQFEEKRDSKGRRITKKRLESMKKNLANANKSRLAKKHAQNNIQEYDIQSESETESESSDSDSDDELLEAVMNKKKKKEKAPLKESKSSAKPTVDPRIERLEAIVLNLAENVKKSHKKMKKANKGSKSEKIVLVQPNNTRPAPEKKSGKQGTDLLVEMLKNNVMF